MEQFRKFLRDKAFALVLTFFIKIHIYIMYKILTKAYKLNYSIFSLLRIIGLFCFFL